MNTGTQSTQYDTPVGVGGTINTNTGQITSGSLAGSQAGTAANNYVATPVSQTQNASQINNQLSGQTSGTVFPTPPATPTKGISANTSIPNPIATPQDIINQGNTQTPGETTNQNLLQKVASLIGQKKSQTGMINDAENAAGIPALTKTVTDLNTQLEGLNNQALDLQNQARPGGAIENNEQQGALGRGITSAGLAPQTAGDLRKNQIQQSAIASQALTLKSAIYGAQGQLSLAKDAADKAAAAQYEDQQNKIDYQKALIEANLPQMNKEEKNQALLIQTQLADRQTQINQAMDDKKTIVALAAAAMKNNPNNPAAQYAAQQALVESNKPQPNLQTAFSLIGKYQSDPLDIQMKLASIDASRASAAKTRLETDQLKTNGTSNPLVDANTRKTTSGITYVDGTNLTGKVALAAQQAAAAAGIPYLDKTSADLQNNVETARQNMQNIQNSLQGVLPSGFGSGFNYLQKVGNAISGATQIGDNAATLGAFNAYRSAAIQALRAMAGAKGLRINQAEIMQSVNQDIPKTTDTYEVAMKKLQVVNSLLDSQEKGTFGSQYYAPAGSGASGTTVMTGPGGTFNVPNSQIATFKANGYK